MVGPAQTVLSVHAGSADSSGRDLRGFMRVSPAVFTAISEKAGWYGLWPGP
jgi:hypothetical protein